MSRYPTGVLHYWKIDILIYYMSHHICNCQLGVCHFCLFFISVLHLGRFNLITQYNCFQDNNVERAVEWIFSHADELDTPMDTGDEPASSSGSQTQYRDGSGSKYTQLLTSPSLSLPNC